MKKFQSKKMVLSASRLATVAALVLLTTTGTAAHAEEDSYSKIGDQLVPVGDHNKYSHKYERFNVSTNPLAYMWGTFSLGVSVALHENVAVRVDADYYHSFDVDLVGGGASIGVPLYFRKVYDGFFIEPGARVFTIKDQESDSAVTFYGPTMLAGWHWIWDSGFNISAALGAGRTWGSTESSGEQANFEGTLPAGYLRMGKTF